MKVASLKCKSQQELAQEIVRIKKQEFKPTLAIVFSSVSHNFKELGSLFKGQNIDMIGCSTAGEIINGTLNEASIAVLLLNIDRNWYKIVEEEFTHQGIYKAAFNLGKDAIEYFENPGMIVMSGGLTIDAEELVSGLRDGVVRSIPIFGGLAGNDFSKMRTFAFTNSWVSYQGLAALVIDLDKVSVHGRAISGWEPVGGENVITKAKANVVYQINGESAYDVFIRYFGLSDDPDSSKMDQLIALQTNYPFQLVRDEGYAVLRSPMLINKDDGSIILTASVKEGDKFRFSYSPGFEVIEQTIQEFGVFYEKNPDPDALILFSCKGRHGAFGPMLEDEIEGIYEQWKKPLIGFLSYGEIGDMGKGMCEFHNETCSLVLLKER